LSSLPADIFNPVIRKPDKKKFIDHHLKLKKVQYPIRLKAESVDYNKNHYNIGSTPF
jgi:hypothetical protein